MFGKFCYHFILKASLLIWSFFPHERKLNFQFPNKCSSYLLSLMERPDALFLSVLPTSNNDFVQINFKIFSLTSIYLTSRTINTSFFRAIQYQCKTSISAVYLNSIYKYKHEQDVPHIGNWCFEWVFLLALVKNLTLRKTFKLGLRRRP